MNRPLLFSGISGLLWGALGSWLFWRHSGSSNPLFFYAAPFGIAVGFAIYFASRPFYRKSFIWLYPVAFATTYIGVFLFGLILGFADLISNPDRIPYAVVLQAANACVWGLTFIPVYWILFAVAFLNHSLIRLSEKRQAEQGAAAN